MTAMADEPADRSSRSRGLRRWYDLRRPGSSGSWRQAAPDPEGGRRCQFHVPRGTTFAVVGESGCGKSTLAKLVSGLQRPTAGEIVLRLMRQRPARPRRRADDLPGPVCQPKSALDRARHRGRADPHAGLCMRGAATERRVDRLLEQVGLGRSRRPNIRTSSRAASGSGSRSPARWRPSPSSWCWTSRPRRSTSRCRRRS